MKILGTLLKLPGFWFFLISMSADYSFYVKSIAACAPTFFGYIISVLASVIKKSTWWCTIKLYLTYSLQRLLLQNRFQPDIYWYSSIHQAMIFKLQTKPWISIIYGTGYKHSKLFDCFGCSSVSRKYLSFRTLLQGKIIWF